MSVNKIFGRIYSVELQSEVVELASIGIITSDAERMKKGVLKLKELRAQMKSIYLTSIDKANTNAGIFKQKAKELGLNPDDFPLVKNFFDRQKELDDAFYSANKL